MIAPVYIVVRDPKPRILPQWLRARLGERYMNVNVQPFWVEHPDQARRFAFMAAAQAYITRTDDGARCNGMETAIVRPYGVYVVPE